MQTPLLFDPVPLGRRVADGVGEVVLRNARHQLRLTYDRTGYLFFNIFYGSGEAPGTNLHFQLSKDGAPASYAVASQDVFSGLIGGVQLYFPALTGDYSLALYRGDGSILFMNYAAWSVTYCEDVVVHS